MKNIILCGFMGCGKSTMGRRLAKQLGCEFVDMDRYIEEKQKISVKEIFARHGEEAFRRMETEASRQLAAQTGLVIATGGGTLLNPDNTAALRSTGVIVLLDVPLAALQERLKNDTTRPLLQKPDRNQVIRNLHETRMPQYRAAADVCVNAGAPFQVVADRIIQGVEAYESSRNSQNNGKQSG